MTDETFVYRSDVNERANVAKLSKKRVSKSGCTLPSDNMSHWAKKKENGDIIIMAPNRPILYDDFKELSEEMQKQYLQSLIDNYGGTTERIAKMWSISESKVKFHRQTLGVQTRLVDPIRDYEDIELDAQKWGGFLTANSFLREPMKIDSFHRLTKNEQKNYLEFLVNDLEGSCKEIGEMLGVSEERVRQFKNKFGFPPVKRNFRYPHVKWNEWIIKYDTHCGVHQIDETHYEYPNVEPMIPENHIDISTTDTTEPISIEQKPIEIKESDIPYLNLIMTVKDYEQIFDILKTLPRAESGTITFTFGEESEKLAT